MPFNMLVDYVRVYNEVPPLLLQTKIFLEGAYNASSDMMNANLTIPSASPYAEDLRTANVPNSDIVDWVLVQLRTGIEESTVVISKSAFLHKN